ncbi:MAG: DinB family protein [Bacteroidota bacterium]
MNQLLLPFFYFILPFCGVTQADNQIWTLTDRQHLITGLKTSQSGILREIEQLSDKQMHFRADSSQWSIAEIVEHISVYEELLYWDLSNNLYTDERHDLVDTVKGIDSAMTAYATDPNKGQASFVVQPLGRFHKKEDLANYFNRYRNEVIKLIHDTKADFRLHFVFRPPDWGIWRVRDLHQYTLLWIAHTERHLHQIKKVKANPNYPK